eukprot:10364255-Ditylum_brightwellii.AAC.1
MGIVDLSVAVVLAVFGAAAMSSLALEKHLFAAQSVVEFVVLIVVCVIIVDLAVDAITPALVAVAMASLALMKRPFAPARHYIPFCLYL